MGTNGVRTDCPGLAVALLSWEKEEEDDALPVVLLLTLGVRRENARGQDPVRHLSNLPSGPGLCGFGLGLGLDPGSTHSEEQRLKPAAQSQLCSPIPEQHGMGVGSRGGEQKRAWEGVAQKMVGEGHRTGTRNGQALEPLQALGLQPIC